MSYTRKVDSQKSQPKSGNGDVPRREDKTEAMEKKREKGHISAEEELRELKQFYARLQVELRKERMCADLLDEMINVGEAMFKVPIRKKSGAKR